MISKVIRGLLFVSPKSEDGVTPFLLCDLLNYAYINIYQAIIIISDRNNDRVLLNTAICEYVNVYDTDQQLYYISTKVSLGRSLALLFF